MKSITVRSGRTILIDDQDFERVCRHPLSTGLTKYGVPYAWIRVDQKNLPLHRFILGVNSSRDIDHINGNPLDNRRSNLRIATHQENMANQDRHKDSKSPFKGIWFSKATGKWAAQVCHKGRKFYLGVFADPSEAARAYDQKAKELFGAFARLNFSAVGS